VQRAQVIAHRGASAYEPEHTLAAYDLALEQGADALELDIRASADGQLVIVHDDTLARTGGDPRRVDELARAEIAAPALDEVLGRYGASTRYVLDLKYPSLSWEGLVVEAIERHGVGGRTLVQAFDHSALVRLNGALPRDALAALYVDGYAPTLADLDQVAASAGGIGPWHEHVDAGMVAAARERGLAVRPWTADAPEDIERLVALGVEAVITNVPDVALAIARTRAAAA
jgi:glycerophosphoryl diester phosphodiesterase